METSTSGQSMFMFHFRRKLREIYSVTGINFKWKERQTHTNLVFWPSEHAEPQGFFVLIVFEYLNPDTQMESYTNYKITVQYYANGEFHNKKEFKINSQKQDTEYIVQKIVFWGSGARVWKERFV